MLLPSALSQWVCVEFQALGEANCHLHGGNKAESSEVQQAQEPCDKQSRRYIGCRRLDSDAWDSDGWDSDGWDSERLGQ